MSLKTGNRGEVPASYLKPAADSGEPLSNNVNRKAVVCDSMEERLKTFPWLGC